jgi:hypothetical protein
MIPHKTGYLIIFLLILTALSCSDANETIYGRWKFMPEEGTDIVSWRYRQQELEITDNRGEITILHYFYYRKKATYVDSTICTPGRGPANSIQTTPNWAGNWYMGVLTKVGSEKKVDGKWQEAYKNLQVVKEEVVQTSQGEMQLKTTREYRVDRDRLIVLEKRSTRPTPVTLVFEKKVAE